MKRRLLVLVGVTFPVIASAQRFTVTPVAGFYGPLNEENARTYDECHYACIGTWSWSWQTGEGRTFGVRVGVEYDQRNAIEASVLKGTAARWTTREFTAPGYSDPLRTETTAESIGNTFLTLQYRRTVPLSSRSDFTVGLGTSLIEFGGLANQREQTYFGVFPSLSFRTTIGAARFDVSLADAIYRIQYLMPVDGHSSFTQHDLMLTAGLQIGGQN